jgi:hypothetical protein
MGAGVVMRLSIRPGTVSRRHPGATSGPSAGARMPFTPPSPDPQPYEKVITKDAKSKKGIFTVHQVKDKYYYEIPKSEFDKDYLWVTQIARTTLGVGYGGQGLNDHVVRWEQNGNRVHLDDGGFVTPEGSHRKRHQNR